MTGSNPQARPTRRTRNQLYGHGRNNAMNEEEDGADADAESFDKPNIRFEDDATREENMDQLTLSFKGQVYVFDSVSPEKVQAVLLLLGGHEILSAVPGMPNVAPQSQKEASELPRRSSLPRRAVSSNRFREKRKERCFDKKTRSSISEKAAHRMRRFKGQFAFSKPSPREESIFWSPKETPVQLETLRCTHCKTSSKSTPVMRRGPHGPKTLCNACGLKWANKGTLKNFPRTAAEANQAEKQATEGDESEDGGNFVNLSEAIDVPPLNVDVSVAVTPKQQCK